MGDFVEMPCMKCGAPVELSAIEARGIAGAVCGACDVPPPVDLDRVCTCKHALEFHGAEGGRCLVSNDGALMCDCEGFLAQSVAALESVLRSRDQEAGAVVAQSPELQARWLDIVTAGIGSGRTPGEAWMAADKVLSKFIERGYSLSAGSKKERMFCAFCAEVTEQSSTGAGGRAAWRCGACGAYRAD